MIEAFWRSLKYQWLYLNSLDSIERLRALVAFFIEQYNTQMPHPAFSGQTPDEMYFGTAVDLPAELAAARSKAREERLVANRAMSCNQCIGQRSRPAGVANSSMIPARSLLRTGFYRRSSCAAALTTARLSLDSSKPLLIMPSTT